MAPLLKVEHITKDYPAGTAAICHALKNINFEIQPGEFIGVMGASGAGKTTLLNLLATLDQPTNGQIFFNQQALTTLKGRSLAQFRAQQISFIFQDFKLLDRLTVAENIALPLRLQAFTNQQITVAVAKIACQLGLTSLLKVMPTALSNGQRQQVAIARALVHQPALLFGDEPTGALDSGSARALLETLVTLNQKTQISILLTTHDPLAASYCQRIFYLKDGGIIQQLTRQHRTRAEFYQAIVQLLAQVE